MKATPIGHRLLHHQLVWTLLVALVCGSNSFAQVALTTQHVDLNLSNPSSTWGNPNPLGTWTLTAGDRDNSVNYLPNGAPGATNWAILTALPAAQIARPAGSSFDFLGVPEGQPIWLLPQSQNPNLLYLGVSGYSGGSPITGSNGFGRYTLTDVRVNNGSPTNGAWIQLSLVNVRGPGSFSVFQNGATGPVVWMASSDGIGSNDDLFIVDGGHIHYNWAFTQPGRYEIDLRATAFLADGSGNATLQTTSPLTTYVFDVQGVPEPSSIAFGALAAGWWFVRRARRRE